MNKYKYGVERDDLSGQSDEWLTFYQLHNRVGAVIIAWCGVYLMFVAHPLVGAVTLVGAVFCWRSKESKVLERRMSGRVTETRLRS